MMQIHHPCSEIDSETSYLCGCVISNPFAGSQNSIFKFGIKILFNMFIQYIVIQFRRITVKIIFNGFSLLLRLSGNNLLLILFPQIHLNLRDFLFSDRILTAQPEFSQCTSRIQLVLEKSILIYYNFTH